MKLANELAPAAPAQAANAAPPPAPGMTAVAQDYAKAPLAYVPNVGQTATQVQFTAQRAGGERGPGRLVPGAGPTEGASTRPFTAWGNDLVLEVPVGAAEAVLGASVDVPTLDGTRLTVKVSPGTSSGSRLRGKGIPGGGQYEVPGELVSILHLS